MDIELTVYGYANEETEEPDPLATTALEFWQHQQRPSDIDAMDSPPITNPDKFRDVKPESIKKVEKLVDAMKSEMWGKIPTEPRPQPIERPSFQIKADDGSPLNADIGGFHIFKKPIELFPQMADENGQIKLTVVVQMDDDGKKLKAAVTTDNKGWLHFQ